MTWIGAEGRRGIHDVLPGFVNPQAGFSYLESIGYRLQRSRRAPGRCRGAGPAPRRCSALLGTGSDLAPDQSTEVPVCATATALPRGSSAPGNPPEPGPGGPRRSPPPHWGFSNGLYWQNFRGTTGMPITAAPTPSPNKHVLPFASAIQAFPLRAAGSKAPRCVCKQSSATD